MSNDAVTLISVESLINSHDDKLATIKKESTVQKDMLKNILENNDEYMKLTEEINKLKKLQKSPSKKP